MMTEHPKLLIASMVRAILAGKKTQTRVPIKKDFIYSLTDDCIYGIHTKNNVLTKGNHNEIEAKIYPGVAEQQLYGWFRWTNLLSNEIQGLWEKGVRGVVSAKRPQDRQGIPKHFTLPQQSKNHKVGTPVNLYGISWDARKRIYAGETFGWQPSKQSSRKFEVGNTTGQLDGQEGSRERKRRGKTSDGKVKQCGVRTLEVGDQGWAVQSAAGGAYIKNVPGWNMSCDSQQIGQLLYVREKFRYLNRNIHSTEIVGACFRHIRGGRVFNDKHKGSDAPEARLRFTPSIHMPRWASRIDLLVKKVWVERVQEITEADAIAEGIKEWVPPDDWWDYVGENPAVAKQEWLDGKRFWQPYPIYPKRKQDGVFDCPIKSFRSLWDSIYAKKGYGWDTNPRLFVTEFELINRKDS